MLRVWALSLIAANIGPGMGPSEPMNAPRFCNRSDQLRHFIEIAAARAPSSACISTRDTRLYEPRHEAARHNPNLTTARPHRLAIPEAAPWATSRSTARARARSDSQPRALAVTHGQAAVPPACIAQLSIAVLEHPDS
jgi:hypothetical protein